MSGRGEVFLGDLARAVAGLRPADAETMAAVARLLGLEPDSAPDPAADSAAAERAYGDPASSPPPPRTPAPRPSAEGGRPEGRGEAPSRAVPAAVRPARTRPLAGGPDLRARRNRERARRLGDRPVDFSLTALDPLPGTAGERRDGSSSPAPDPELLRRGVVTTGLRHEPPWKRDWERGVMFAAVATTTESTVCDQPALLRKVARQEVLRSLPLRRRLTTRRGAQLLLDHGRAMAPFRDDRAWLGELVGSVAGRDRVEVLRFRGTPGRGVVRDDPRVRAAYRPPAPGTPVVLFSDLGRMRPAFASGAVAGPDEWRAFVDSVVHAGCPVVCVTPYQAADYSLALRRVVAFIPLDHRISLRHAHDATSRVRRALEGV
ncbi:hypothetical protein DEJ44_28705 [Streptomyces venezuelae]|uniref:hypothetical protein n=1 Tax=Streptomyces venezuelae TaxID=54571 RepID=UPI00123949F2|nr:hypothetical protein [Streptomyces venezuelae]QES09213.1 hypothetical protein DEJ44_28705 [Streptomyces venezuelae]